MKSLYFWVGLALLTLVLIISFGNSSTNVPIFIFLKATQMSQTIVMLFIASLGFLAGVCFGLYFTQARANYNEKDNLL